MVGVLVVLAHGSSDEVALGSPRFQPPYHGSMGFEMETVLLL
jgi:hypothetical protein